MIANDEVKSQVPAVDKVLDVLEFIAENPEQFNAASLIKQLDLPQASGFRIINALIQRSYIVKDAQTNFISLGYKAIRFGNAALAQSKIRRMIHPILEEVTDQTGESAELAWLDNSEIYFLDMTESPQPVRLLRQIGMRVLGITNPVALAILSHLPEDQRQQVISLAAQSVEAKRKMKLDVDQHGIVYDDNIDEETLKTVARQGFASDYGIQKKDVARIAVPILGDQKTAIGTLSVAGPVYRMLPEQQSRIVELLKKNVEKITMLLGNN